MNVRQNPTARRLVRCPTCDTWCLGPYCPQHNPTTAMLPIPPDCDIRNSDGEGVGTTIIAGDFVRLPGWPLGQGAVVVRTENRPEGICLLLQNETGIGTYLALGFEKMLPGKALPNDT